MADELGATAGLATALVLAVIGSMLLTASKHHERTLGFHIKLFLGAFLVRYLMSVIIYQGGLIHVIKDEDGSVWSVGIAYRNAWMSRGLTLLDLPMECLDAFTKRNLGYTYLLGVTYYITGPARLPAAALNCFFGSVTIVYACRIAETLFSDKIGRQVGLWLCFFPSMIIWSAQTIKEPVVIMLEVIGLYACVRLRRQGFSVVYLAICAVCIVLMIPFRFYAAYVTTAAVVLASIVPKTTSNQTKVGPVIGALIILGFLVSSGAMASKSASTEGFDLKYMEKYRKNLASGGSGVKVEGDIRTPGGMGRALVVGGAHLLLAPFPWQMRGARAIMMSPEQLFWWWLFVRGVVPGMIYTVRTRFFEILPILIFLMGFGILYSLTFGNVGLAYRQRAQLLPGLMVFGAVGLERRRLLQQAGLSAGSRAGAELLHRAPTLDREMANVYHGPDELY
jgi:hypothetical protein